MNENSLASKCSRCGATVAADAPEGLCPQCLIALNFATPTEVTGEEETGPEGTRVVNPPTPPARAPSELAPFFPQLEILGLLGSGGMGAVYKARQPKLDRCVALKILLRRRADGTADRAFAERFAREARALARLNHPNIVAVYDYGEAGGYPFLVMEYVDGLTLRQVLQRGKFAPEEALQIVPKICEALHFAHKQGVVHRDIKPENILLDKEGQVKIADFGIAKIVAPGARDLALTGGKEVVGTPHYMAPEQVEQPAKVDHRADIFSLGVVFYEMLTGELPLGKFAPPSKKVHVDVRLDEVVLHALEKEPERRYQHASEVKTDVETIAGRLASAPSAPNLSATTPRLRRFQAAGFFFAAVCFAVAALSFFKEDGNTIAALLSFVAVLGFGIAGYRYLQAGLSPRPNGIKTDVPGSPPPRLGVAAVLMSVVVGYTVGLLAGLVIQGSKFDFGRYGDTQLLQLPRINLAGDQLTIAVFLLAAVGSWIWSWAVLPNVSGRAQRRLFRVLGAVGYVVALPMIGFSGFFLFALTQQSGGWNPAPTEAVIVPIIFAGALVLPVCGWWLRRIAHQVPVTSGARPQAGIPASPHQHNLREVRGPAIGMLVAGILNWILIPLVIVTVRWMVPLQWKEANMHLSNAAINGVCVASLAACSFVIYAALKMMRLEAYRAAVAGSVAALLVPPGNIIGLPLGIWGLVTLARPHVRAAFRRSSGVDWYIPAWGMFLALGLLGAYVIQSAGRLLQRAQPTGALAVSLEQGLSASNERARRFVRLVADAATLTFEGRPTRWEDVGTLLNNVPDRTNTVLEFAVTSDQITVSQQNEWFHRASALGRQYGFEYASFVGIQPLGSKGTSKPVRSQD